MALFTAVSLPAGRLAVIGALLAFVAIMFVCLQKLYFHPLAKYPGPVLAKFTDLYAAYHAWKGDIHIDMWKQHQKYGHFVRYAPNRLHVDTSTALRDIYAGHKNFIKGVNYRVLRHGPANTLTMIHREEHARRRRIVSQGVSDSALRSLEPRVMAHIKRCLAGAVSASTTTTRDNKSGYANMSDWFSWLTFDFIGDVVFGRHHNLLETPENRAIPEAIMDSNVRMSVIVQSTLILRLGRLDKWLFPKSIKARNTFLAFVRQWIDATKDAFVPGTILDSLHKTEDPVTNEKLTADQILAEGINLIVAGADTSSTALAATFFYIARNRHVYDRLQLEIRNAFSSADEIRMNNMGGLPYMRACIDEALRMSPPAGSALYREVLPGGAVVDGHDLPAGVIVGVPIYAIHHNEDYFPSADTYRPERWLATKSANPYHNVEMARAAFTPFSVGPRGCVGKGMAMMELSLAVAYAMYTLDFKIVDGPQYGYLRDSCEQNGEYILRDHITALKT